MRRILIIVVLVALAAAIFSVPEYRGKAEQAVAAIAAQFKAKAAPAAARQQGGRGEGRDRAVSVEIAKARAATASAHIRAIGSLESDESVQIATEIAGRLSEIMFEEGETVKKGEVLVKLDDALARAEMADAQARFKLAESNLARARTLSRTGSGTEKSQDEAVSNFGVAEAAVELARVRLAKHEIAVPFDGTVGLRKMSPGAYLGPGAAIVNLEKLNPLKVDFRVPEIYLAAISTGQPIDVTVDALPGRTFTGTIRAIDPHVDVNGRALTIRAELPNPDGVLRPGLFARIVIKGKAEREVVTVPESTIVPRGGDTFVYRVEDGKAVETKVALGGRANGRVEIVEGLRPDTTVVTAGQLKLRDGVAIETVAVSGTAASPGGPGS